MNKLVIHVGLPKTATTFLQTNIFPNIPGYSMLRGWRSHRMLMNSKLGENLLITDEVISGYFFEGALMEQFYTNIKRIKDIYNEPKIIFGIRSQDTYIPSIYRQFLHQKGFQDFNYLFNDDNTGLIKLEEMLFMPRINFLKENFKEVFIYSQESIKNRQDDFLTALATFMEVEEKIEVKSTGKHSNIGVKTQLQVNLLRRTNKFSNRLENIAPWLGLYSKVPKRLRVTPRDFCQFYLKGIPSPAFKIEQEVVDFIKQYYKDDWDAASKAISY